MPMVVRLYRQLVGSLGKRSSVLLPVLIMGKRLEQALVLLIQEGMLDVRLS